MTDTPSNAENDIEMEAKSSLEAEEELKVEIINLKQQLDKEKLLRKGLEIENEALKTEIYDLRNPVQINVINDPKNKKEQKKIEKEQKKINKEQLRIKALKSFEEYTKYRVKYGGPCTLKSWEFWKGNNGHDKRGFVESWTRKKEEKKKDEKKKPVVPFVPKVTNKIDTKNFYISMNGERSTGVNL